MGKKVITNEEIITNYKVAHDGYIFGVKRRKRNLTHDKNNKPLNLNCKFCNNINDDAKHIMTVCEYTKKIKHHIEQVLEKKIKNDDMLFNHKTKKYVWIVISILKKIMVKQ